MPDPSASPKTGSTAIRRPVARAGARPGLDLSLDLEISSRGLLEPVQHTGQRRAGPFGDEPRAGQLAEQLGTRLVGSTPQGCRDVAAELGRARRRSEEVELRCEPD